MQRFAPVAALAILATVYLLLPYHGIQWGDGLEFVAVSTHLGIAHPPGYPLFTILAWLFQKLPAVDPYMATLRLSRLGGVLTAIGLYFVLKYWNPSGDQSKATWIAPTSLALMIGFSPLLFSSLHHVEVYTLNAAFLVIISAVLLQDFQNPISMRRLLLAAMLLGIGMGNHLSLLCMAPLLGLRLLQRHDVMESSMRLEFSNFALKSAIIPTLLVTFFGLIPFAALYGSLLLRVPAPDSHGIAWGSTNSLSALLDHMRGGEYRQMQFLQSRPGQAFTLETWIPFFTNRIALLFLNIGNLLSANSTSAILLGIPLTIVILLGAIDDWMQQERRLVTVGLAIAILLQMLFIVTYNIPDIADYYLGVVVLTLPFMLSGFGRLGEIIRLSNFKTTAAPCLMLLSIIALFIKAERPTNGLAENWRARLLEKLPENASLITAGDADVYTMWYAQFALGERSDVLVVGANFLRFPWFRETLNPSDIRRDVVQFVAGPPPSGFNALGRHISSIGRQAIDPLLEHGPVYTTINNPMELAELEKYYDLELVAELFTEQEIAMILNEGLVNFPPDTLIAIRKRSRSY